MTARAAIYARVSQDAQRDNFSVPTQVAACLQYARNRGYAVVGHQYVDPETGRDAERGILAYVDDLSSRELSRPGLDASLTFLEAVGFDVLIIHALDRLARDPYIRQTLEMEFTRRGAKVEFVLGNYDESPEGEVRKDLDATFGKWENAKRVERCNRGKLGKAQRGAFVAGPAPHGYQIDARAPGGLVIDETEAAVVRRIFEMYAKDGASLRDVARTLTALGAEAPRGGKVWDCSSVHHILRDPVYVGHLYYNKHKRVNGKNVKRDPSEWVEIKTPQLVGDALWREAQYRLEHNLAVKRRAPHHFYLLGGMVRCAECQKCYVGSTKHTCKAKQHTYYEHRKNNGHCRNHMIPGPYLEALVWDKIERMFLKLENLSQGYEESIAQQRVATARKQAHLETLRRGIIKLEQKRANLHAAYIDPEIGMTKVDYLTQKSQLDEENKVLLRQVAEVEKELAETPTAESLADFEAFARDVQFGILEGELAPEEKRKVLETLHVKVMIGADDIRLEGWLSSEGQGVLSNASGCTRRAPR